MAVNSALNFAAKCARTRVELTFTWVLLVVGLSGTQALAHSSSHDPLNHFEQRIRPVLVERCYSCHNSHGNAQAGLALDHEQGLRQGGRSGTLFSPEKPEESLLIRVLRHDRDVARMPKDDGKLSDRTVDDFVKWIKMGAPDPRKKPPSVEELEKETSWEAVRDRRLGWWSFQPIQNSPAPQVIDEGWSSHPVDRFLLAKLEERDLEPVGTTDPRSFLRRLSFALVGLPPEVDEMEAFVQRWDVDRQEAIEEWVDQYLSSPHFGEKWARHWMDWMRYAESHGSEGDPGIPHAYLYRDYLIRAINQDVPYDQLIREHIAGDLLEDPRLNHDLGLNESKIGLAHYRFVEHGYAPTDALEEHVRFTENQIDVISKAFLGLTVSCARCHDHKFDPISQEDYYALYGIMASTRPALICVDTESRDELDSELKSQKERLKAELIENWKRESQGFSGELLARSSDALPAEDSEASLSPKQLAWNRALRATRENMMESPLWAWVELRDKSEDSFLAGWNALMAKWKEDWPETPDTSDSWALSDWYTHGHESALKQIDAGALVLHHEGEEIVASILTSGIYSSLDSHKRAAVLSSPEFDVGMKDIWVRARGDGARLRYVMSNYPRVAGPIYAQHGFGGGEERWYRFDMTYWQGSRAHLEVATAADLPVEARDQVPSWFGISEVRPLLAGQEVPGWRPRDVSGALLDVAQAEAPESLEELARLYQRALDNCLEAWSESRLKDHQARFIDFLVRYELLPNSRDTVPEARSNLARYRALLESEPFPLRVPGLFEAECGDRPLFVRGDHRVVGDRVPRRFLEAIDSTAYEDQSSGRLSLARDLTRADNPLTARVFVNRVWNYLFAGGFVSTVDNFGRLGAEPTHPELLDALAREVMDNGYSLKRLIRWLVTTKAFRLSSLPSAKAPGLDPENRWLSHARVRRLEAEEIRDSMLWVSGRLDRNMYGPSVSERDSRRSLYVGARRQGLSPFLSAFDFPAPFSTKGQRDQTNVPAQALAMMNDPFVRELARDWANRVLEDDSFDSKEDRITHMWRRALSRPPRAGELESALAYLEEVEESQKADLKHIQVIGETLENLDRKIRFLIEETQGRIRAERPIGATPNLVPPIARWDFDTGLQDSLMGLQAKGFGGARIEDGFLLLEEDAFVATEPLRVDLAEKTLEIWLKIDDLDQRGGGVMTVQDLEGEQFDSLVFAERRPGEWMAGSDFFKRTEDFEGAPESRRDELLHLAIVYDPDGTIRMFREGALYGQPYPSDGPAVFGSDHSQVLFGLRHGNEPSRRGPWSGAIDRAQLYDRALSEEEVRASSGGDPAFVSRREVSAALSPHVRRSLEMWEQEREECRVELREFTSRPGISDVGRPWYDLALAIFNLKEFLYLQ